MDKDCPTEEKQRWVLHTRVIVLLESLAEDFKGTAELLGSETGMEGKEDLNDFDDFVGVLGNCTHLDVYRGMRRSSGA
jgi:hypothetical protein